MNQLEYRGFIHSYNRAWRHRSSGRYPYWLTSQAPFTEEVTISQDSDHGLLAALRQDCQPHPSLQDAEERIRLLALRENYCVLLKGTCSPPRAALRKKYPRVE